MKKKCNEPESGIPRFKKIVLVMRLTLLLIVMAVVSSSAASFGQNTKLNLNFKDRQIREILSQIEDQSEYTFMYDNKQIDVSRKVSVGVQSADIKEALDEIFKGMDVTYKVMDRHIMLVAEAGSVMRKNIKVSGKVTDTSGVSLPGVTVVVKGTTNGTITNFDGIYSLSDVPDNGIIQFSFVGMKMQEISVAGKSTIDVVMAEDAIGLEEVVAIGYGTMRKSDLTGSITSVDQNKLSTGLVAVRSPLQALNGLSSGVQVSQNSGAPGGSIHVRIRGGNSLLGSNEPLYVVDGFPLSSIRNVNPNDIKSIEILKDASATAIYGSRGANGVILITTKEGKKGKTVVEYDSYYGIQKEAKRIDMLNAEEFATLANIRAANDGEEPFFSESEINSFGEGTDWQDEVFRLAPIQNHTLTLSGGNEATKFSASGNYFNQQGIIINSYYDRYSLRTNFNHNITSKWSFSLNSMLSRAKYNNLKSDNTSRGSGVLSGALVAPPTVEPMNEDGEYNDITIYAFSPDVAENPLAVAKERKSVKTRNTAIVNLATELEILKHLSFRASLGVRYVSARNDYYASSKLRTSTSGSASIDYDESLTIINENILTYKNTIKEKHSLTLMGGVTSEKTINQGANASSKVFLNDILENYRLQSGSSPGIPTSYYNDYSILSYLYRMIYGYDGKYILTASIRADGSSRFGSDNKWGYFPSSALAWRVTEEPFMKNLRNISNLKIRASWGQTGSTAVSPYQSLPTLSSVETIFDNDLYIAFVPGTTMPNSGLKWETTTQKDIGLDLGLFKNRINLTLDYYHKKTKDLLSSVSLPYSSGYRQITTNIGSIQNKGFEFSMSSLIIDRDIKWDLGFNVSINRNKVLSLADDADIYGESLSQPLSGVSVNIAREGEPVGVFYGFLEEDELSDDGLIQYKDLYEDGEINTNDKTIIGDPNPDFIYGFNSSVSYRNFTLNILATGVYGNDIFNFNSTTVADGFSFGINQITDVLGNYWTEENPDPYAKYPKISKNTRYSASDRYIEDGSYLRLRNIQLTYTFMDVASKFSWLNDSQLYISAQNLITLTNYSWYSPDVSTKGGSSSFSQGLDIFGFPDAKTFTIGLKLNL